MRIKLTALVILIGVSIAIQAGPRYNDDAIIEIPIDGSEPAKTSTNPNKVDADRWLTEFRDARNKTFDGQFLGDYDKRRSHGQVVKDLSDRAEKLFGDIGSQYGNCTQAALNLNSYWWLEANQISDPSQNPTQIGTIVSMAWNGGEYYTTCRDLIDAIKP